VEADHAILAAAIALLASGGYEALTMEKVAAGAAVGKATVYRRWGSKVELVVDAMRKAISEVEVHHTDSLRDDLIAYAGAIVHWLRDSDTGRIMVGMTAEIQHNAELAEAMRTNLLAPRRRAIRDRLIQAVAAGELRRDVDVEVLLDLLVGPLFFRLLVTDGPIDITVAEQVVDVVLTGGGQTGHS
jgi:AcrR family transcriptional regulator